jgi:hypothetical protein
MIDNVCHQLSEVFILFVGYKYVAIELVCKAEAIKKEEKTTQTTR